MKKAVCFVLIGAFALGFGLSTLAPTAAAYPECVNFCDASTGLLTTCCWEFIPNNPNCQGPNCPGIYDWVCIDYPGGC